MRPLNFFRSGSFRGKEGSTPKKGLSFVEKASVFPPSSPSDPLPRTGEVQISHPRARGISITSTNEVFAGSAGYPRSSDSPLELPFFNPPDPPFFPFVEKARSAIVKKMMRTNRTARMLKKKKSRKRMIFDIGPPMCDSPNSN